MSKSKGEFLTVSLLESKGYDPIAYRFFCLQSHYRKSLVFSYENLDNAAIAYNKLVAKIAALKPAENETVDVDTFAALDGKFREAMDNDLNTSLGVTALYDVLKAKTNATTKLALIEAFDKVLSLDLIAHAKALSETGNEEAAEQTANASAEISVEEIEALIVERKEAKKAKNFARADEIRQYLLDKGVTLIDTREGTTYKIG
jgi:cysteinyl-tRNA synthetase